MKIATTIFRISTKVINTKLFEISKSLNVPTDALRGIIGTVPQQRNLQLYIAFDDVTEMTNTVGYRKCSNCSPSAKLVEDYPGPFGIPKSAFSTDMQCPSCDIVSHKFSPPIRMSSFTLSFFWRSNSANGINGIFHDSRCCDFSRFSIISRFENLEIHSHNASVAYWERQVYGNSRSVAIVPNIFKQRQWTFVAITYENGHLQVFDKYGSVIHDQWNFHIDPVVTEFVDIGRAYRYGTNYFMTPSTAISCLSYHNSVLTRQQITALPCACQFKQTLMTGQFRQIN